MNSTAVRRTAGLLPPAGAPRNLALAQLANSVGDGAFIVTSALFFTRVVGLSTAQVGLGLTTAWLMGFLTGVPLGHLADRRGPRGIAILLALSTSAAVCSFLFVRSFPLFLVAAVIYAGSQTGLQPRGKLYSLDWSNQVSEPVSGPSCSPRLTQASESAQHWAASRCASTPQPHT